MDATTTDPLVGRLLDGRYRVESRIARGGMATVFAAHDTRLDRTVAVKIMHPGFAQDPAFVRRFVREARSAAKLSHPGVVAVFDQGEDDGTLYLAMELVRGHTLRHLLHQEGALPPGRALNVFEQILSALAAAHDAGIVHLDIKPENVLLGPDGRVKVADFGLARAVTAVPSTATHGILIGTVSYLSPEQIVNGRADGRSDLYSAGVVLFEMLSGRKPYDGDSPIRVAYRHAHEDVPPPSRTVPTIPPYVDGLVLRATARDPEARPADTRLFLAQVRRAQSAFAHGLDDDPELTEDLTLFRRGAAEGREERPPVEHTAVVGSDDGEGDATGSAAEAGPRRELGRQPGEDAGSAAARRTPSHPSRPRQPITNRRRGLVALVVVLVLAVGAAVSAWYYGIGRFTEVPPLRGLTPAQAAAQLTELDLRLDRVGTVPHEVIPRGEVVRAEPSAAERVLRGSAVQVWLSGGPERFAMPDLNGTSVDRARALVREAHLRIGSVTEEYHDTVPKGRVVSFTPAADTPLRRDSPVTMVVSRGPRPVAVPNVTGRPEPEAVQAIRDAGLRPSRTGEEFSPDVPAGAVVSQQPAQGTLLRGDLVSYVVSKGPELVPVPDVIRRPEAEAVAALEAAGLVPDIRQSSVHIGLGIVLTQNPPPGQSVPRGSTVTIELV